MFSGGVCATSPTKTGRYLFRETEYLFANKIMGRQKLTIPRPAQPQRFAHCYNSRQGESQRNGGLVKDCRAAEKGT